MTTNAAEQNYAVFRTGGKQYRAGPQTRLTVEKLEGQIGGKIRIEDVLLVAMDGQYMIGRPTVPGAAVIAQIEDQRQDKKKIHFRYKNKTHGGTRRGHRQQLTDITILSVEAPGIKKAKPAPAKKAAEPKPEAAEQQPAAEAPPAEPAEAAAPQPAKAKPKTAAAKPKKPAAKPAAAKAKKPAAKAKPKTAASNKEAQDGS